MSESSFDDFEHHFAAGRALLAERAAAQLRRVAPAQLALARRAGGRALREPLVHAWLADSANGSGSGGGGGVLGIDQLLYGHLRPEDRPPRLAVRARGGVVLLPGMGALRVAAHDEPDVRDAPAVPDVRDAPAARGALELRAAPGMEPTLWREERPVPATFTARRTVPGTAIELYDEVPPLVTSFFRQRPEAHELEVADTSRRCLPALARALALLGRVAPQQRAWIERDCRALLVLHSEKVRSLAALDAYGMAVLSVPGEGPSELGLAEDLAHQVGHISFFAITAQPCFTIAAETPLAYFTSLADDHRTLFAAFHGNYTILRMAQFFDAALEHGALAEPLRHELLGRFALAMTRFEAGLVSIDDERLYTPMAWALHRRMVEVYEELDGRRRGLLASCDLDEQPYVFDYRVFCARNPRGEAMMAPSARHA